MASASDAGQQAAGGAARRAAAAAEAAYAKHTTAWQKRQDGKSTSEMWDWLKPIAEYGSPPGAGGAPPIVVAEYLQALCGKRLSATNPTVAYKNHMNCIK